MTEPAPAGPPPVDVDPAAVIHELVTHSDMGRALWERAKWRVAADVLQRRVVELERQHAPREGGPDA